MPNLHTTSYRYALALSLALVACQRAPAPQADGADDARADAIADSSDSTPADAGLDAPVEATIDQRPDVAACPRGWHVVPSPFDPRVGPAVAAAVSEAARRDGVATR